MKKIVIFVAIFSILCPSAYAMQTFQHQQKATCPVRTGIGAISKQIKAVVQSRAAQANTWFARQRANITCRNVAKPVLKLCAICAIIFLVDANGKLAQEMAQTNVNGAAHEPVHYSSSDYYECERQQMMMDPVWRLHRPNWDWNHRGPCHRSYVF
ncbi:MAG: hypothetical protein UU47_C0012G0007 [candidate division TM6 bacterium GW2011_GWE2_41_16]|nr:MAG: hypothetical protein UU47_C0012G0007 [candidate division TM6 bacterium GW2011_GWE2_41_16]